MIMDSSTRALKILRYFKAGYKYKDILALLRKENIFLSLRQLKRILASHGLFRRKTDVSFAHVCDVMENELNNSGCLLGYRRMHQKLKVKYQIQTSQAVVSQIQRLLDPDGVENRKRNRLTRRKYHVKGPNYLWHIDGYDKLKPYGFCIHGCIDGYSRKIIWLETADSNNCPKVVAGYFLKIVEELGGTSRVIRGDAGNENVYVAGIQRFFRSNDSDGMAGEKSFLFGKSTSNQRIEGFWSQLRKCVAQWWMDYFKDMREDGSWDDSDPIQRECLKFCFGLVIQKELDDAKELHNTHRIRPYPNQECPSGIPNLIYELPERHGTFNFQIAVTKQDIKLASSFSKRKSIFGCDVDFEKIALHYMNQSNKEFPKTAGSARILYDELLDFIASI